MGELRMFARLGSETASHHAEADADVDRFLFRSSPTAADYRTYLARVYGFVLPIESALASAPGLDEVLDVKPRAKSALLAHDLIALGMSMEQVSDVPQCLSIPSFRGPAAALGWLYVIERPMLASSVIRRHLETTLHAQMTYASSYLSCYSGHTGTMWRELGLAMDKVAHTAAVADRIVAAAHEAFRSLQRWRKHDLQRSSNIRYAG